MASLLLYSSKITPRLLYTVNLVFKELMGAECHVTDNEADFISESEIPKICYDEAPLPEKGGIFLKATGLLSEKGVHHRKIPIGTYEDEITIFAHQHLESCLPFDILSAVFYLVSRYEEYLPHTVDKHGRFPAQESFAYRNKFLRQPVVNIWVKQLEKLLKKEYSSFEIYQRYYKFIPSYDIDIAYCYRYKGFVRNTGRALLSLKNLQFKEIYHQINILWGKRHDPYDTYQYIREKNENAGVKGLYFFLIGEYAQYDKNIGIEYKEYQELIQSIADYANIGIHPSYRSNSDIKILQKEIQQLSEVVKNDIIKSRQHFIKLKMPDTYENLLKNDIQKDYSMGYASQIGFRAGIASSFEFYHLKKEMRTPLRIFPFMLMDVTLRDYLSLDPQTAIRKSVKIIERCKQTGGIFSMIWHNHTLSEHGNWRNWRKVYEELMKAAV